MLIHQRMRNCRFSIMIHEEIRHQDNLINARLSWLVSSQSFLLSGFAVTLAASAESLPLVYAKVSSVLSASLLVAGLVTVLASYLMITERWLL